MELSVSTLAKQCNQLWKHPPGVGTTILEQNISPVHNRRSLSFIVTFQKLGIMRVALCDKSKDLLGMRTCKKTAYLLSPNNAHHGCGPALQAIRPFVPLTLCLLLIMLLLLLVLHLLLLLLLLL